MSGRLKVPSETDRKDPQLPETGYLPNQREPEYRNIHGPQDQIPNDYSGYVWRVSHLRRLERYLILGTEDGTIHREEAVLEIPSLKELIDNKRGMEAVRKIKEVSVQRRCAKQKFVVHCLAICAKSGDPDTKKAAYEILPEVCKIPSDLFLFLNFCKENSTGTGWGHAHRRAISSWYIHNHSPLKLAYLVTKYWTRYNFSHRDTLRLAHASSDDPSLGLILRYIAKEHGRGVANENEVIFRNDPSAAAVKAFLEACQRARKCENANELCDLIRQHNLAREHINTDMLRYKDVWEALLEKMPMEAMLRNLRKMGSLNMFAENSKAEDAVIQKLNRIGNLDMEREEIHPDDDDDEPMGPMLAYTHPFRILQALTEYQ